MLNNYSVYELCLGVFLYSIYLVIYIKYMKYSERNWSMS